MMQQLSDMHEKCRQCNFDYARIDAEAWGNQSSRRVMCPICGWTAYEEHTWEDGAATLNKRNEAFGFGAFRLIPPGGYTGYNAFHAAPAAEVVESIKELLTVKGWKGYLSLWDPKTGKAQLVVGHPLQKFDVIGR
jgi:hypothetical protein